MGELRLADGPSVSRHRTLAGVRYEVKQRVLHVTGRPMSSERCCPKRLEKLIRVLESAELLRSCRSNAGFREFGVPLLVIRHEPRPLDLPNSAFGPAPPLHLPASRLT